MLGGKIVRQEDGHFDVCIKSPGGGGGQYYCTILQVAATPRAGRGEESIDQLQCADIYTYLHI